MSTIDYNATFRQRDDITIELNFRIEIDSSSYEQYVYVMGGGISAIPFSEMSIDNHLGLLVYLNIFKCTFDYLMHLADWQYRFVNNYIDCRWSIEA